MKKILIFSLLVVILGVPSFATKRNKKAKLPPRAVTAVRLTTSDATGSCGEQVFKYTANIDGDQSLKVVWTTTGGEVQSEGKDASILTKGLAPGSYTITAEVTDPTYQCVTYDSLNFVVAACPKPPVKTCFTGDVNLSMNQTAPSQGEIVTISASSVTGGDANKTITWAASSGTVVEQTNDTLRLNLTSSKPGETVIVKYKIETDLPDCGLEKEISFKLADPPIVVTPEPRELGTCSTFKLNNARVDNACKAILETVIRQLESDPAARLVIVGSARKNEASKFATDRATNIKTVLTKGGTFATVDENRVEVRTNKQADGSAKLILVPAGAKY